ncbi:MAG: hypothetical protein Q8O88_03400 [bacterium]|nr:hypothetical protein [bacterium]
MEGYCLLTQNYENRGVCFEEKRRKIKALKHSELRDPKFINGRVKQTINNPDFIYSDFDYPKSREVYYKFEFKINGKNVYTKVVIDITKIPLLVVSVFRPDYIKEQNKTKLLYGKI